MPRAALETRVEAFVAIMSGYSPLLYLGGCRSSLPLACAGTEHAALLSALGMSVRGVRVRTSPPSHLVNNRESMTNRRTYWDYLRVPELLGAQQPVTDHHDEMQFIVVHQIHELWFKLILHELVHVRDILAARDVSELQLVRAHHYLARVNVVWGIMVQQIHVMETMRPVDFLAFRDALAPASGFQSLQLRLIETLAGLTEDQRITYGGQDYRTFAGFPCEMINQIDEIFARGSLRDLLMPFLSQIPIADRDRDVVRTRSLACGLQIEAQLSHMFSTEGLSRDRVTDRVIKEQGERAERERRLRELVDSRGFQAMLAIYTWPERFALAYQVCEDLIAFEQSFILWRMHHVRTVERFIGKKTGTAGSTGVSYLEKTACYRIFEDLWTVRTLLIHPGEPEACQDPCVSR